MRPQNVGSRHLRNNGALVARCGRVAVASSCRFGVLRDGCGARNCSFFYPALTPSARKRTSGPCWANFATRPNGAESWSDRLECQSRFLSQKRWAGIVLILLLEINQIQAENLELVRLNAESDFFLEFDGLSMKSVWSRRAAEQTLRRRPSKHQRQTEQRWLVSGWRLVKDCAGSSLICKTLSSSLLLAGFPIRRTRHRVLWPFERALARRRRSWPV
jgi:hypothetical protein